MFWKVFPSISEQYLVTWKQDKKHCYLANSPTELQTSEVFSYWSIYSFSFFCSLLYTMLIVPWWTYEQSVLPAGVRHLHVRCSRSHVISCALIIVRGAFFSVLFFWDSLDVLLTLSWCLMKWRVSVHKRKLKLYCLDPVLGASCLFFGLHMNMKNTFERLLGES